ncbi:hypothetical protein VP01_1407g2 [Puccinia sorghi]|uniref:No apical meristem-associated C-terminal domain-containing protein n=1 Tax=Puccinia sorghi TaxID=27349 RepID=A0A0L6VKV8_9BASI|nr:hypothetical protein VP01_1407g2 [Puccinia sorghi]
MAKAFPLLVQPADQRIPQLCDAEQQEEDDSVRGVALTKPTDCIEGVLGSASPKTSLQIKAFVVLLLKFKCKTKHQPSNPENAANMSLLQPLQNPCRVTLFQNNTRPKKGGTSESTNKAQAEGKSKRKGKAINISSTSRAVKRKAQMVEKKKQAAELKQRIMEEEKSQQALWPRISQDKLEAIQLAIENMAVPSTVTWVPKLVGMSGNRSLKAAEWHILFCIYFPLVLVPLWFFGPQNHHCKFLLETTASLISITNLLSASS